MSDDLLILASRCEAASGPDQTLDIAIAAAIGLPGPGSGPSVSIPWFTGSLDSALSLVNGAWWEVRQMYAPDSPLRNYGGNRGIFHARVGEHFGTEGVLGQSNTPALALCAAALRARAALA